MKKITLLFLFLTILVQSTFLQAQGDNLFDDDTVHEIYLTFEETNYWEILTGNYNSSYPDVPYIMVDAVIDGEAIDSIGVRLKGYSSYGVETDKKSIKLDFNEFVAGKKYDGLRKLNLNNGEGDPAVQRDKLCYDIMRQAGVSAPRTSYSKVYLNDTYWGLYLLVEQVDKTFLNENVGSPTGNLFKNMEYSNLDWQGSDISTYQETFALKTDLQDGAWESLVNLMDVINNTSDSNFKTAIEEVFDVDLYLKVLAVDVATQNWDSYIAHGRNFYLYENLETGKFQWIPWDYNFSMGGSFSIDFGGPIDPFGANFPIDMSSSGKVLIDRLLSVPEYEEQYYKHWCAMLENNFTAERLFPMIESAGDLIRDFIYEDPNYMWTTDEFEADLDQGDDYIPGLKKFIEERIVELEPELVELFDCSTLLSNLEFNDVVINEFCASCDSLSGIMDSAEEYDDWIELYNNTDATIDLSNAYLTDKIEEPTQWAFPQGTMIEAGAYLIIWADKDNGQEGLHANFKLAKAGEFIQLTDYDKVLDALTYEEQTTNETASRIPNGTGDFVIKSPSFNVNNELSSFVSEDFAQQQVRVFPNPAHSVLYVNLEDIPQAGTTISLYSTLGQKIIQQTVSDRRNTLQINSVVSGMYVLVIENQEQGIFYNQKINVF